jgi:hypothetical protein
MKGYDFIINEGNFNSQDAVVRLGVGKNMVTAINFWMKAFGISNEKSEPTELGNFIFGKNGKDRYLEDIGTLWLLHYELIKIEFSSIYSLVFNEFIRERREFTKDQLHFFLKRKCIEKSENSYNPNTINADISVFLRNYLMPKRGFSKVDIEEDYLGLLIELELVQLKRIKNTEGNIIDIYTIEEKLQQSLPSEIFLFTLLDCFNSNTISIKDMYQVDNGPAKLFCLNLDGLYSKFEEITKKYPEIIFNRTAGNEVLQFTKSMDKWEVLNEYYN